MPPVKTGASGRLIKIPHRCQVGSKKSRKFLYRCEWDDDPWFRNRVKLQRRIQCTLSSFDSTLSNFTSFSREFFKPHSSLQIDRWSFRDTVDLQFPHPDIPDFLSTSTPSSITAEHHRD